MRAPNDASEPQRADVKPTGMLGPASLNGWTMSPVRRWKRLMSPHGVFQLPKSLASLSEAADSAWSSCSAGALLDDVVVGGHACLARGVGDAAPDLLAPEHGERRRHRRRRPAQVPRAQQLDLLGQLRLQRTRSRAFRPRP